MDVATVFESSKRPVADAEVDAVVRFVVIVVIEVVGPVDATKSNFAFFQKPFLSFAANKL